MWAYAKAAIIVVLTISLFVGGWKANGWRLEAQAAEVLRLELRNELQRRVKSDADRPLTPPEASLSLYRCLSS
jgi:hypothetical protein